MARLSTADPDADRSPAGPAVGYRLVRPGSAMGGGAFAVPVDKGAYAFAPADRPRKGLAALRADPRKAVQQDSIRCLICGRAFRQLTNTHLRAHRTLAAEYKRRFGYNQGRPLMSRALQRLYAERAVNAGLAARIRSRPILVEPDLRRRGGARRIALEESLTRRDARRHTAGANKLSVGGG